jgi:hypothetical protein
MEQCPSWQANSNFAASQEIPRIYGTWKFLTVPTRARHIFYATLLNINETFSVYSWHMKMLCIE